MNDECIEEGGDRRACRERLGEWIRACMAEHCEDDEERGERADGDECVDGCGLRARAAYDECLETGRDEEPCRERARVFHEHCVEEHCEEAEEHDGEAEGGVCAEACNVRGRLMNDECIEQGGDRRACRERCAGAEGGGR